MTSYLYTTTLTVPAATPIAAPVSAPQVLQDEQLVSVRVVIPPGHAGLTGLMITWGGTQVVPYVAGTWLTGDDELIDFAWNGEVTQNGLVAAGYNLDVFPHTFTMRWSLTDLTAATPVVIASPQASPQVAASVPPGVGDLTVTTDATGQLSDADLAALGLSAVPS